MYTSPALPPVPPETARAVQSVLEENPAYAVLSGEMDSLLIPCCDHAGRDRLSGEPAQFLQFSVVTLLQRIWRFTDGQAEEAMRARAEWRYILHLPLGHAGFQSHRFCLFRQGLYAEDSAGALFQLIQERVAALHDWPNLPAGSYSFHDIISDVCRLNQASFFASALAQALADLAAFRPQWLRQTALPHWYSRYAVHEVERTTTARPQAMSVSLGQVTKDISYLLAALALCEDAESLQLPVIRRLIRVSRLDCETCDTRERRCDYCHRCIVGASIAGELDRP